MKLNKNKPVWIFDDGGKAADRYTAVYNFLQVAKNYYGPGLHYEYYLYVGFSPAPFFPLGISQHGKIGNGIFNPDNYDEAHLGKEIEYEELNRDGLILIRQDLECFVLEDEEEKEQIAAEIKKLNFLIEKLKEQETK